MKNFFKKTITLALCAMMVFGMAACGGGGGGSTSGSNDGKVKIIVPDYIRDKVGMNEWTAARQKAFEKAYPNIKVNYVTFDSNETMYTKMANGGITVDVIIPSDYMLGRLIEEDMLLELNFDNIPNAQYIDSVFKEKQKYDPENKYTVPYTVGMVGLIYNTTMVDDEVDSWSILWDEKYKGEILMFNNPRDAFGIAQFLLGQSVNTHNPEDWDKAIELLKEQRPLVSSYVMDEVYGKMETGEAAIAPYYAGDYLTMYEVNEDLAFFYPKEGTNIFVDAACIPSCCQNYEAAMLYINFLLEPDIALANAEYIGYASPNTTVFNNPDYYYYGNEILYPPEDKTPKTEYYHDLNKDVRFYYEDLWIDVKLH
jgi:spermidine/putrescine transport system substrate-binding protein